MENREFNRNAWIIDIDLKDALNIFLWSEQYLLLYVYFFPCLPLKSVLVPLVYWGGNTPKYAAFLAHILALSLQMNHIEHTTRKWKHTKGFHNAVARNQPSFLWDTRMQKWITNKTCISLSISY